MTSCQAGILRPRLLHATPGQRPDADQCIAAETAEQNQRSQVTVRQQVSGGPCGHAPQHRVAREPAEVGRQQQCSHQDETRGDKQERGLTPPRRRRPEVDERRYHHAGDDADHTRDRRGDVDPEEAPFAEPSPPAVRAGPARRVTNVRRETERNQGPGATCGYCNLVDGV